MFFFVKSVNSIDLFYLSGSKNLIKVLIDAKAEVNAKTNNGLTPLHYAARDSGMVFRVEVLVENKAEVNEEDNLGKTPLDYAEESGKKNYFYVW